MPKFHALHYNFTAKRINEVLPVKIYDDPPVNQVMYMAARTILAALAINFAKKFKEDNPGFDPVKFLDACSKGDRNSFADYWED